MKRAWPLLILALVGCDLLPGEWKGWVYPNRNNLADDIPLGAFRALEECRASAKAVLARTEERRDEEGETITGDYECGFKCKPDGGMGGLNICERTER